MQSGRMLAGVVRGGIAAALRRPVHRCGMAAGPQAAWASVQRRSFGLYDEMLAMAGRMETAQATRRPVPVHIVLPDYATTGTPTAKLPKAQWMIEQHSDADIELARIAGRISREVLDEAAKVVAPGVTTDEIDRVVHEETIKRGAYPSPLNYHGFPRSVCTSINEVVCHGIPESRTLKEGDVLNIDVSCYVGGFHGDNSEMFCVGEVDDAAKKLIQVC
jgi:methionyl aminopeptidase